MQQKIIILDFGSQTTQLIGRRVRELDTFCEILPYNKFPHDDPSVIGVILSGSPYSVYDPEAFRVDLTRIRGKYPILGICYGAQYMAHTYGGKVEPAASREYGRANLKSFDHTNPLFHGFQENSQVWMSHGDSVDRMAPGFTVTATTPTCPYAAVEDKARKFYGVQFHPEVVHSVEGEKMIRSFVLDIVGARADWNMGSFVNDAIEDIRRTVGDKTVLCGLSGGVDSSVAAVLIHKAIGDQLVCVFVNNGMLRKNEAQSVIDLFSKNFSMRLQYADAEDDFLAALKGVTEPESKRKIIGKLFVDTFYREARKCGDISFLAQGTLYPDVVESKSPFGGPSSTIKSHHNVGGLPEDLKWQLLEPLKDLFKDEVRVLGKELGLPDELVYRHPFPGPGLGVRCIGEVTKERLDTLRDIDAIFIDEIRKAGLYDKIWQAFADLLPVKSVGVQGDERTYREVCTLRAVTSEDAMTADWYRMPYDVLQRASSRICNEVKGVNRVLYDVTSKPPATIEWE